MEFLDRFLKKSPPHQNVPNIKKSPTSNTTKILPVGIELIHSGRQADRWMDNRIWRKLIGTFREYAKVPQASAPGAQYYSIEFPVTRRIKTNCPPPMSGSCPPPPRVPFPRPEIVIYITAVGKVGQNLNLSTFSYIKHKSPWLKLDKIFYTFYRTRRFITMLTKAHCLTLFWIRQIKSAPSYSVPLRFILVLSCRPKLRFFTFEASN